ncbi:hypothetical protein C4J81_02290 [Deltaproteobacteria bacterium Smac51]|nr:hypothetical protein C4J81_02290 [Deltaproteobacteria bacterium Smac51]
MGLCDNEEFTADDREILGDMLFQIFESATAENRPVNRDMIRAEIGKLWDWPQISSVLGDLEEKEYIDTLSTRGGGIFQPGERWQVWVDEMAPIDHDKRKAEAARPAEEVRLTDKEASALVELISGLVSAEAGAELLEKVHCCVLEKEDAAAVLKKLASI